MIEIRQLNNDSFRTSNWAHYYFSYKNYIEQSDYAIKDHPDIVISPTNWGRFKLTLIF